MPLLKCAVHNEVKITANAICKELKNMKEKMMHIKKESQLQKNDSIMVVIILFIKRKTSEKKTTNKGKNADAVKLYVVTS